jgi:hypothetical protein
VRCTLRACIHTQQQAQAARDHRRRAAEEQRPDFEAAVLEIAGKPHAERQRAHQRAEHAEQASQPQQRVVHRLSL